MKLGYVSESLQLLSAEIVSVAKMDRIIDAVFTASVFLLV